MSVSEEKVEQDRIDSVQDFAQHSDYSLLNALSADPDATRSGEDHQPRQVFSGHYVPVVPTPLPDPEYVAHSFGLFTELGLSDQLAHSAEFVRLFSGDLSHAPEPMREQGWACGYALSIYGTEYYRQCPFQTGNGYGDGRALSVFEGVFNHKRWEMQLKGGGRTPYCRGGDGRAVLRSSIREFLAQEYMHALGIPTSRSLTLYVSRSEQVQRPWYSEGSRATNPDRMILEPAAISTRVAPSFIRVGQLELFARRARKAEHPNAMDELQQLVRHLIDREYRSEISPDLTFAQQVVELARLFRGRLTALVARWIGAGYCQGNFNSDNCAAGGFTLDYGPFGFCEAFEPAYQPWTGGGEHFSFLNQPSAAERNYHMFWQSLRVLEDLDEQHRAELDQIREGFGDTMRQELELVWTAKLGLVKYDAELLAELLNLMAATPVDFTLFFRELSHLPETTEPLEKSFYPVSSFWGRSSKLNQRWTQWFDRWRSIVLTELEQEGLTQSDWVARMKMINPKYTLREWHLVEAYQAAYQGDYEPIRALQQVITRPFDEQTAEVEAHYYRLRPLALFDLGGVSHYSCSS